MNRELFFYTDEELQKWNSITQGLYSIGGMSNTGKDKYGNPIPYHLGPHSLYAIKKVCEIVKPKSILEIGFNMGHSASMWLNFTDANLISVDISDKDETLHGVELLKSKFDDRFNFILSDSKSVLNKLENKTFDLIFIDGDHLFEGVKSDIQLGFDLGVQNFCFDDWLPQYGPGVQPAIALFPLKIVNVFNNISLAKVI